MNVPEMLRLKMGESLERRIISMIKKDYSVLSGDKLQEMFAKDVVELIREEWKDPDKLEIGQVVWLGVDVNDKPSYGKTAAKTQFKPVILSLVSFEDIELMASGANLRQVRQQRIARIIQEAFDQGALLTYNDVGYLLTASQNTISKGARDYMEREKKVLPSRGFIHDLGPAVTHKRIIIRLYLEGKHVPQISRITDHSEAAIDSYLNAFKRVRRLKDKMGEKELALTLRMGRKLVREYLKLIEEHERGGIDA